MNTQSATEFMLKNKDKTSTAGNGGQEYTGILENKKSKKKKDGKC